MNMCIRLDAETEKEIKEMCNEMGLKSLGGFIKMCVRTIYIYYMRDNLPLELKSAIRLLGGRI